MSKQVNIISSKVLPVRPSKRLNRWHPESPNRQNSYAKRIGSSIWGVSGVMGITGDVMGWSSSPSPIEVALKAIGALVGESHGSINAEVIDGVKEFTNIIVGNAAEI